MVWGEAGWIEGLVRLPSGVSTYGTGGGKGGWRGSRKGFKSKMNVQTWLKTEATRGKGIDCREGGAGWWKVPGAVGVKGVVVFPVLFPLFLLLTRNDSPSEMPNGKTDHLLLLLSPSCNGPTRDTGRRGRQFDRKSLMIAIFIPGFDTLSQGRVGGRVGVMPEAQHVASHNPERDRSTARPGFEPGPHSSF